MYIEGRIQTRQWEDQNGNKKYTTEIIANEMKMLDSRQSGSQTNNQPNGQNLINTSTPANDPFEGDEPPF